MPVYLHHIETLVPEVAYQQDIAVDYFKAYIQAERKTARLIDRIFGQSEIEKRHSVVPDFMGIQEKSGLFYDAEAKQLTIPSTKARNDAYNIEAKGMFSCVAKQAIARCPGIERHDISHVITVSCTGFFAPGPDYEVVKNLDLALDTHRFHIGFMGCYAAFPALKMARAFCQADAEAVVLVICTELCSLHLQAHHDIDSLIASSVFADGSAAVLVSARAPLGRALEIKDFATTLAPEGDQDMAWNIGDTGFEMVLSTYVPRILEANIKAAIQPLLEHFCISQDDIDRWAVHPGGRAILDKVAKGLGLSADDMKASRDILRDYGNMSSPSILFVLESLMQQAEPQESVYALAFGPGLTVESGLFSLITAS